MQSSLKLVDCIIEVHDARIPLSGRNPLFQETLGLKPHVLVLNKMDLADLKQQQVKVPVRARSASGLPRLGLQTGAGWFPRTGLLRQTALCLQRYSHASLPLCLLEVQKTEGASPMGHGQAVGPLAHLAGST
uniref:Mitochondrial ribosome-associated GTPase 1 n=1 Tax=Neovison vison TaxID=452646 RepID=A0A8C7AQM3_NEOVI